MSIEFNEETLLALNACPEGIAFAKRNNLLGYPVENFQNIIGDFNGFVDWFRVRLVEGTPYDASKDIIPTDEAGVVRDGDGNITSVARDNGTTYWEYDSIGNCTNVTHPDGEWCSWVYEVTEDLLLKITMTKSIGGDEVILQIPKI